MLATLSTLIHPSVISSISFHPSVYSDINLDMSSSIFLSVYIIILILHIHPPSQHIWHDSMYLAMYSLFLQGCSTRRAIRNLGLMSHRFLSVKTCRPEPTQGIKQGEAYVWWEILVHVLATGYPSNKFFKHFKKSIVFSRSPNCQ